MTNLIIENLIKKYEKKIGYKLELWELKYLYTSGEILITDEEENALIKL